ncbi:MAG: PKD domain-containing protein [Dehalococcoidia bacterium]|nr:PKD domain-containing protein [Dehalococcoidia bacterium]
MHRPLLLVLLLLSLVTGCSRQLQTDITTPPTADFTASPENGAAPLKVTFTDSSSGDITHWHWDFGDGQFSNDSETDHTYAAAGNYTVSLAIMGPGGSDVETKTEYIKVATGVISWEEAGSYIGQNQVVEGIVVSTYYAAGTKSQITYLDFHKPYENYFKCIIWGRDREKFVREFPPSPETYFLNKHVQVTGLIEEYPKASGVPEMALKDPSQIKLAEE